MKNKGLKQIFSFVIVFAMIFTLMMPVAVAYAATTLSTVSTIPNGAVNSTITVSLAGDTFKDGPAQALANWTINVGTTGLTVDSIALDYSTYAQVNINFLGTALAGTISIQAKAIALTSDTASNSINVAVTTISAEPTIANGKVNPTIVVKLVGDTFLDPAATDAINWVIDPGSTELVAPTTPGAIILNTAKNQATISFTGKAAAGTVTVQATLGVLTGGSVSGYPSNQISVNVPAAVTITTDPLNNAKGVPVNKVIKLTTNALCTLDTLLYPITLATGSSSCILKTIQNGNEILIVPSEMLSGGSDYTLTIPAGALTNVTTGRTNLQSSISFTTAFNLNELINSAYTDVTLNTLIRDHSPRGLIVNVPKRYMTKIDIAYSTNSTNPLTNVDITAEAEVAKINVQFGTDGPINQAIKIGTGWNTGYEGSLTALNDKGQSIGQDIIFEALDKYDRSLERKLVIKLNVKGNKVDLSGAKSLTVPKTLADLILNNGKSLTDILKQYTLDELTLSVAP